MYLTDKLAVQSLVDLLANCCFISGVVPFDLWSVVVKLLSDDEPVVREEMALGLSFLLRRIQASSLGKCTDNSAC